MIGFFAAICVAALIVRSHFARDVLMPLIIALEAMPKIAFAPLLVLWLGLGPEPKVLLAASIAFFPLVINLWRGLKDINDDIAEYGRLVRLSEWQMLIHIRMRHSVGHVFDGLRIAIPGAMVGAVLGEFIVSNSGLGYRLLISNAHLKLDMTFACLFLIGTISLSAYLVVNISEHLLVPWKKALTDGE